MSDSSPGSQPSVFIPMPPEAETGPERWRRRLLGPLSMELVSKVGGPLMVALGLGRLIVADADGWKNFWTGLILSAVAATGSAAVWSWWLARREDRRVSAVEPLYGVLQMLQRALIDVEATDAGCRVCLYAPRPADVSAANSAARLFRVTPYFDADGADGSAAAPLETSLGAVGLCYRTNERRFVRCPPDQDLVSFLMTYGFTAEQAARVRPDRRAWAAVPIEEGDGAVQGVLFADSDDPDFFGPPAGGADTEGRHGHPRRRIMVGAAVAALAFAQTYDSKKKGGRPA